MSKPKAAAKIASASLTKKEMLGMSVAAGTASSIAGAQSNYTINKARSGKARVKNAYYRRKLKNGKTIKVRKAATHGVGYNQLPQNYGGGY